MAKSAPISSKQVLSNPINFIACGFGSGLAPVMPGTFGTLVAVPFYLLLRQLSPLIYFIVLLLLVLAAIWVCDRSARNLGVHDHPAIVADEMVGYWLTMFMVPFSWTAVLVGFVLFRLFDICKPWPIRWVDRNVKGGFGIVVDDLLAAVYAGILLQLIVHLMVRWTF